MPIQSVKELAADKGPARFPIPGTKKSVPNPAHNTDGSTFWGPLSQVELNPIQAKNLKAIQAALPANQKLKFIGICAYVGGADYNTRFWKGEDAQAKLVSFVVVDNPKTPTVVWQKYEGKVAGGGRNMIGINGQFMKTSEWFAFAALDKKHPGLQDILAELGYRLGALRAGNKVSYQLYKGDEPVRTPKNFPPEVQKILGPRGRLV